MKKISLILIFLTIIACDVNTDKKEGSSIAEAPITGTFKYEYHWSAPNGINESNKWVELFFDSSDTKFIYSYKYKNYQTGGGWTFNPNWDGWDWEMYEYEIEGAQMRTRKYSISNSNSWSDWSAYALNENSITFTFQGMNGRNTYSR